MEARFDLPAIPLTVFVDATGTIQHLEIGKVSSAKLITLAETHLGAQQS